MKSDQSDASDDNDGVFLPHGGYRKLRSYKVAQAVYDATVVFCRRFHPNDRRMTDQMVQAARSGVRNISEGSGMAATSRKSEMKLTNVARASLSDELLRDFESFLVQRGLRVWPKDSREAKAIRTRLAQDLATNLPPTRTGTVRLTGLFGLSEFVEKAEPELVANAMLCAVNQAAYLLKRQLESQGDTFVKSGGFTEKLYGARKRSRSEWSDQFDKPASAPTVASPWPNAPPARAARRAGHSGVARPTRIARAYNLSQRENFSNATPPTRPASPVPQHGFRVATNRRLSPLRPIPVSSHRTAAMTSCSATANPRSSTTPRSTSATVSLTGVPARTTRWCKPLATTGADEVGTVPTTVEEFEFVFIGRV